MAPRASSIKEQGNTNRGSSDTQPEQRSGPFLTPGVPCTVWAALAVSMASGIRFVGAPQPKSMQRFSGCVYLKEDLKLIRFRGGGIWQQDFRVLNFVSVEEPRSMHGFSPNFQDMFTLRESTAYLVLGISGNNSCHGNTFKIFWS